MQRTDSSEPLVSVLHVANRDFGRTGGESGNGGNDPVSDSEVAHPHKRFAAFVLRRQALASTEVPESMRGR
jgi:hypothetical protein